MSIGVFKLGTLQSVFDVRFDFGAKMRFVRRGGPSDSDFEIDSDCEVEEIRDFLDAPGKGAMWDLLQPGEKKLTKYLDPGTIADLFQHYVATRQMLGAEAVSYLVWKMLVLCQTLEIIAITLWSPEVWNLYEGVQRAVVRRAEISWQNHVPLIIFHFWKLANHKSDPELRFAQCELCYHFKSGISKAKSLEERLGQLVQYRRHLADQYQDRAAQWSLQELCLDETSDLLCIQVDGMDQSKYSLPRDPCLRATAAVSSGCNLSVYVSVLHPKPSVTKDTYVIKDILRPTQKRPRLTVHGAWAFGILPSESKWFVIVSVVSKVKMLQ